MSKRALITGLTGQDGSYLAELLLSKGYEVHGIVRRSSNFNTMRIDHLVKDPHDPEAKLFMHYGDLSDASALRQTITKVAPDEIYNLGAQSHVRVSFDHAVYTVDVNAVGTVRLLEAVRDYGQPVRVYQASSSEVFGSTPPPQNEHTPFHPRSPYACAKVFSHYQCINYREAYGMFVACGILFNHESERRGETFVTRKISRAVGRIREGLQDKLYLGNLAARRDWGYAPEYVEAMWRMLQAPDADDYVIATGEDHTVQEFCELAFSTLDLDWRDFVEVDPRYFRPSEADYLRGDAKKAREKLGWSPRTSFAELVKVMVLHDHKLAQQERRLRDL